MSRAPATMPKLNDLLYLARDFYRVTRGKEYFHQPQPLGRYFEDERSYYNDFRGKADWEGARIDGIPALFYPALGHEVTFPIMVLQYGLGSIDRYLENGESRYLQQIHGVTGWVLDNLRDDGSYDNHFPVADPSKRFYSANSGMAQGEALSFLVRVTELELAGSRDLERLREAMTAVFANMILPMQDGGTTSLEGDRLRFHEVCSDDHQVVLNGWIYATFGLLDYRRHTGREDVATVLDQTLATMEADLPRYILPDGWSVYDSLGRLASPFYHSLHIHLMDAMARLTGREAFATAFATFTRADTPWKRCAYTARKIGDKLRDKRSYGTRR